jgi:hypothetical protein
MDQIVIGCARKIQEKLGLKHLPEISVITKLLTEYDEEDSLHRLEMLGQLIGIPDGYYGRFESYLELFREEYIQLFYEMNHEKPYHIRLVKVDVSCDGSVISAAYDWLFFGKLRSGKSFCAVLFFMVNQRFERCGLSHLLKSAEIALAQSQHCAFIQTYHDKDNPDFNATLIPNLQEGFVLCPGIRHKEELDGWNEGEFVHLRKYFSATNIIKSYVFFTDGAVCESPAQQQEIIRHLRSLANLKFPGESIANVAYYKK